MDQSQTQSTDSTNEVHATTWARGEALVIWVIWLTYGSFYFCRQNIAAAVDGLEKVEGLTKSEIGWILRALKIAYAIGQLVNGQLAERLSPRILLAIGMLGSAGLNIAFGMSTGFYFLVFVWACNGYFQALGWTPCIRVTANWISPERRGRAIGIIGTSYQFMASMTFLIAGFAANEWGWRAAMYLPSALLILAAFHMLVLLRESPEDAGLTPTASRQSPATNWRTNFRLTLSNPALWVLAVTLGLLDACRYGFTDWGVKHLIDVQGAHVGKSAVKYAILPAGGIIGALFAGWATDRFFAGRRAPVIAGMLLTLGGLTLLYDHASRTSTSGTVVLLFFVGMCIFGPQTLLVGTAPSDLAKQGTAAAAAGFVNFMGYVGAFIGDQMTGFLVDKYDWRTAIMFWAGCAVAAAFVVSAIWFHGPRRET